MVAVMEVADQVRPQVAGDMASLLEVAQVSEQAGQVLESVLWARLHQMRRRLGRVLARSSQDAYVASIYNLYRRLNAGRQARVLISAEFYSCCHRLENTEQAQGGYDLSRLEDGLLYGELFDIVAREHALQELGEGRKGALLAHVKEGSVWSPLGDSFALRGAQGQWTLEAPPMIGDVIALDFDSPLCQSYDPRSGVLSHPYQAFSPQERTRVQAKLQDALSIIDELQPVYGAMIRNFVRRIVIRKSVSQQQVPEVQAQGFAVLSSEHVHRHPGTIRLLNPHLEESTVVLNVEKLLHEATHNFLAAWEVAHSPFVKNDDHARPVSPWSGNAIPNSSFVHATFIYFMCYRLFVDFFGSTHADREGFRQQIAAKLAVFTAGFLIPQSIYDSLLLADRPMHDVRGVMEAMQNKIRAYYADGGASE